VPAAPIRFALVAAVADGVLRLKEKVVGKLGLVGDGTARVAKGKVLRECWMTRRSWSGCNGFFLAECGQKG
jgi:hypothetical protein